MVWRRAHCFKARSTTNLALTASNWTLLGVMTEYSADQYQFTNPRRQTARSSSIKSADHNQCNHWTRDAIAFGVIWTSAFFTDSSIS